MGHRVRQVQGGVPITALNGHIYDKNPAYTKIKENGSEYLSAGGSRIKVDAFLGAVWDSCASSTLDEVREDTASNYQKTVSDFLVVKTLDTLYEAGLVSREGTLRDNAAVDKDPASVSGPMVSIVILNRNGAEYLKDLLPSIKAQTYADIETIVVDNASSDGSVELLKASYPGVIVVESGRNLGFAAGNNLGIKASKGEFIFILNNDTRLDADCVENLVEKARGRKKVAAVAAKMRLFSNPRFINSMGNSISPFTWGSDNFIGYLDLGQFDDVRQVFSACFGAALIPRAVFEEVGLMDEGYGFYYEDTDWCYRARMRGYQIVAAPKAVVYHKFSASMATLPWHYKMGLAVKSRLRFTLKNMEAVNALWMMRNYMLKEDIRNMGRCLLRDKDIAGFFAYLKAWTLFFLSIPRLMLLRRRTQKSRIKQATDKRLFRLLYAVPGPQIDGSDPILSRKNMRTHYMFTGTGGG